VPLVDMIGYKTVSVRFLPLHQEHQAKSRYDRFPTLSLDLFKSFFESLMRSIFPLPWPFMRWVYGEENLWEAEVLE
jgi:hypothetical protein